MFAVSRLFGFLLGTTLAGASVYYYILEEYKVSNELLTEDIYVRTVSPGMAYFASPKTRIAALSPANHLPCLILLTYSTGPSSSHPKTPLVRLGAGEQNRTTEMN